MTRQPLRRVHVVVVALLLSVVMPGRETPGKADMVDMARVRYKPVHIVPTLGIRG